MYIIRIWEGLGNQMFQYAYARALKEKGFSVRLDFDKIGDKSFRKYAGHKQREIAITNFNICVKGLNERIRKRYFFLERDTTLKKLIFWLANHSMWKYKFYEASAAREIPNIDGKEENFYIKGWFQDENIFKHIRKDLIKEFTPCKKIKLPGNLRNALAYEQCVSIHVRRGDFTKIKIAIGLEYYQRAIVFIKSIYDNPLFLIFSDDLEWTKRNLCFEGNKIYVNEEHKLQDYEELFVMSRCKSNIIANSTFSWWAAWLNPNEKKYVIAPTDWPDGQDGIIPDGWITM